MKTEILRQIIEDIKAVPDEQFNMRFWHSVNCQTSCCAIGAHVLAHPEVDLKLRFDYDWGRVKYYSPALEDVDGFYAVAKYLEIGFYEAVHLFDSSAYGCEEFPLKKETVINRIERFIESNVKV